MTGVFAQDFRFAGNYRSQWGSIIAPFRTFSASYDMHLLQGKLGADIMGIGIVASSDKAGQSELSSSRAALSFAYSKALTEGNANYITAGIQAGFARRSFDPANLTFDNQYTGNSFDPGTSSGENFAFQNQSNLYSSL